ncbi:hypothetical protein A8709_16930 [Paenibacillus pectinilyticus]|uniref:Uncharacterized protein n=1 Tax=Paenibacillus pectinilyticus TaxID=512399 RepID=A0A1C1A213_9BACL|nr:Ger(x)C family spore germination protein [Paenibacillus pectinilyticus]OCT14557.1 hypothetical protein A8709_16930 [Paenibacillus pectinilyticus]
MLKRRNGWLFVCIVLLLSGCGRDQRILEKVGATHSTGLDLMPSGMLKVTNSIPLSRGEANGTNEVLTTISDSSKGAKVDLSRQTQLILVSGQLRNALFGMSLARRGFWDDIDTLIRDPSISPRVRVTIVNGEASSILNKNYSSYLRTGPYIDRLLDSETKFQTAPNITLYDFTRDYYDDGIDPVAPIIKDIGDHVIVEGIALFQDDRYKMKIPAKEAIYFAALRENFKMGSLSIVLNKEKDHKELVLFDALVSKRHAKATRGDSGEFNVDFQISVSGSILEYIGDLKISKEADKHKLEGEIADKFNAEIETMMKEMQAQGVDSIGLGSMIKDIVPYQEWKAMDWREVYPHIQIHCTTNVHIKHYGKFQ